MILQISNVEWLMLKDAVSAPDYFKARYTRHDRQMLSDKLNRTFEEQCRPLVQSTCQNPKQRRNRKEDML